MGTDRKSPRRKPIWRRTDGRRAVLLRLRREVADEVAGVDRQIGLATDADHEIAWRPFVLQLDPVERHRFCMALGCRCWNDADPNIAFDQAAHRVEAAQLDAQFEAAADPLGLNRKKAL